MTEQDTQATRRAIRALDTAPGRSIAGATLAMLDGTTLGEAGAIVEQWKAAHRLPYLSPEACRDLAARIEAAMLAERAAS
jgi:hypothetical protein